MNRVTFCAAGVADYDQESKLLEYAASLTLAAHMLYLVALAWIYVVLMVAVAEAASPQGTLVGALFTVIGWGVVPLGLVLYILGTPARRRARDKAESAAVVVADPDGSGHAAGDAAAAEREKL